MPFSNEDPGLSLVKETPGMGDNITVASPGSFSKDGNSSSTIFQASTQSPDQLSFHSRTLANLGTVPSRTQSEMVVTPEKDFSGNTSNILPERDSSLSVNSHTQKRRKFMGSPSVDLNLISNRRIEFGFETTHAEHKSKKSNICAPVTINNGAASHVSSSPIMDKRLQISCSLCRSPLGLHENHQYVWCSLIASTKVHLVSLLKERLEPGDANVSSVPVIITDISSVDQRLCNRTLKSASGKGIWCEEDGCVYNNIFCPFCSIPDNCLGVQIVACDASNFQLLNKVGLIQVLLFCKLSCYCASKFKLYARYASPRKGAPLENLHLVVSFSNLCLICRYCFTWNVWKLGILKQKNTIRQKLRRVCYVSFNFFPHYS